MADQPKLTPEQMEQANAVADQLEAMEALKKENGARLAREDYTNANTGLDVLSSERQRMTVPEGNDTGMYDLFSSATEMAPGMISETAKFAAPMIPYALPGAGQAKLLTEGTSILTGTAIDAYGGTPVGEALKNQVIGSVLGNTVVAGVMAVPAVTKAIAVQSAKTARTGLEGAVQLKKLTQAYVNNIVYGTTTSAELGGKVLSTLLPNSTSSVKTIVETGESIGKLVESGLFNGTVIDPKTLTFPIEEGRMISSFSKLRQSVIDPSLQIVQKEKAAFKKVFDEYTPGVKINGKDLLKEDGTSLLASIRSLIKQRKKLPSTKQPELKTTAPPADRDAYLDIVSPLDPPVPIIPEIQDQTMTEALANIEIALRGKEGVTLSAADDILQNLYASIRSAKGYQEADKLVDTEVLNLTKEIAATLKTRISEKGKIAMKSDAIPSEVRLSFSKSFDELNDIQHQMINTSEALAQYENGLQQQLLRGQKGLQDLSNGAPPGGGAVPVRIGASQFGTGATALVVGTIAHSLGASPMTTAAAAGAGGFVLSLLGSEIYSKYAQTVTLEAFPRAARKISKLLSARGLNYSALPEFEGLYELYKKTAKRIPGVLKASGGEVAKSLGKSVKPGMDLAADLASTTRAIADATGILEGISTNVPIFLGRNGKLVRSIDAIVNDPRAWGVASALVRGEYADMPEAEAQEYSTMSEADRKNVVLQAMQSHPDYFEPSPINGVNSVVLEDDDTRATIADPLEREAFRETVLRKIPDISLRAKAIRAMNEDGRIIPEIAARHKILDIENYSSYEPPPPPEETVSESASSLVDFSAEEVFPFDYENDD